MSYVAEWIELAEAVAGIQRQNDCDEAVAARQLLLMLGDGKIGVRWPGERSPRRGLIDWRSALYMTDHKIVFLPSHPSPTLGLFPLLPGMPGSWLDALPRWAPLLRRSDVEAAMQKPPKGTPKRGGGRRPKYAWASVISKLRKRLEDDGAPADGDGGQAMLEKFVASQFPADDCPSESLIREKVRPAIEAYRRDLNKEGR